MDASCSTAAGSSSSQREGGLAARQLLGITPLTPAIGERFELGGTPAAPLPHPSGASGWLNDSANRARLEVALALVRDELGGERQG